MPTTVNASAVNVAIAVYAAPSDVHCATPLASAKNARCTPSKFDEKTHTSRMGPANVCATVHVSAPAAFFRTFGPFAAYSVFPSSKNSLMPCVASTPAGVVTMISGPSIHGQTDMSTAFADM